MNGGLSPVDMIDTDDCTNPAPVGILGQATYQLVRSGFCPSAGKVLLTFLFGIPVYVFLGNGLMGSGICFEGTPSSFFEGPQ